VTEDGYNWVNYFQEVPSTMVHKYPRRVINDGNDHLRHYSRFKEDMINGNLPPLSYVDPRYYDFPDAPQNDNHPDNADVTEGEKLLKDIYETLRRSPQWNSSLLIITYDEHGGFFDAVSTPFNVPNPDDIIHEDFNFDRLGVRIPTIMVSPWIRRGTVVHRAPPAQQPFNNSEYEIASIPATINKMWGLTSDYLTKRDAWASTFEQLFDELTEPRTDAPLTLPEVPPSPHPLNDMHLPIMGLQQDFVTLAAGLIDDTATVVNGGRKMSEMEGSLYVKNAFSKYAGRCLYPKGTVDWFEGCEKYNN